MLATRGLSPIDPAKAEKRKNETIFINSVRNRPTRSLSSDEREQLQSLTIDKPTVNLEINFDYNSASISEGSLSAVQHLGEALSDPQLRGSTFTVSGFTDAKGSVVNWKFEGYPPSVLSRLGWKQETMIKPGDKITVFGWRARDGGNWAHSREITLAGGKKLFFGPPAGTGDGGAAPTIAVPSAN